jgi:hypothetical protein
MFEIFSRSWEITKLSFGVVKRDKEMLWFPVLSGIFSLIFLVALLFPTLILSAMSGVSNEFGAYAYTLLFLAYVGLAFIATFFNVCTVYTTKVRFEGGDATFMESIKFSLSKIHLIFMWSLVSATVGIILRLIEQAAQRAQGAGKIVLHILRGVLGMAWSIVTVFVIPALVYKNMGPIDAIKDSVGALKKTWGESLIRHFGLGLIQFMFMILGVIVFVMLFILTASLGSTFLIILALLAIIYFVMVFLIFGVANSVYNTALYVYANEGKIPTGFTDETIRHAFESKKEK